MKKLDYKKVFEVLTDEMYVYFIDHNIKSAVLGVSGGIDSTVVAVLLNQVAKDMRAGGRDFTVIGRSIPSKTTATKELISSRNVGMAFCDDFKICDCEKFDQLAFDFSNFCLDSDTIEGTVLMGLTHPKMKLRRGNIKSRFRTVMLYDLAKSNGGIVVGTDNYTEYLLGFSTIGGDGLFDYCPIQHLWKTEIYGLANYFVNSLDLDVKQKKAIQGSIDLVPQDGLGISASDMDQIGAANYFEVDKILQAEKFDKDLGISEEVWNKVIARKIGSEFKRNHPVIIKRDLYE